MATVSKGNCYLCGAELGKTAIKNHLLKKHGQGEQDCVLLKIEGAYEKDYWLYVDIPPEKPLSALDQFLRNIWLECCGHMSAFRTAKSGWGDEISESREVGSFEVGACSQKAWNERIGIFANLSKKWIKIQIKSPFPSPII